MKQIFIWILILLSNVKGQDTLHLDSLNTKDLTFSGGLTLSGVGEMSTGYVDYIDGKYVAIWQQINNPNKIRIEGDTMSAIRLLLNKVHSNDSLLMKANLDYFSLLLATVNWANTVGMGNYYKNGPAWKKLEKEFKKAGYYIELPKSKKR